MSTSWKNIVKLSTAAGTTGVVGWFAGKYYEQQNRENDGRQVILSGTNVRSKPGLPIFGTVSAASPIVPVDSNSVTSDMGSKLSVAESRISQVSLVVTITIFLFSSFSNLDYLDNLHTGVLYWFFLNVYY